MASTALKMNPINLGLRFVLELAALATLAVWGRTQGAGATGLVWMIGVPGVAVAAWGAFAVPGDPSRSDRGFVSMPGWVRLLLWDLTRVDLVAALGTVTIVHYGLSYQRLRWLLRGS
jgi:hypothetical protein